MVLLRALLVGIDTYAGSPLPGAVRDVGRMKAFLDRQTGIAKEVRKLTNEDAGRQAVLDGIAWLAGGDAGKRYVRLFHFSGHGSFVADEDHDEADGRDECLMPFDYTTAGPLTDDVLAKAYAACPAEDLLVLIMDSCCSGSSQKRERKEVVRRYMAPPPTVVERAKQAASAFQRGLDREIAAEVQRGGGTAEEATNRVRARHAKKPFGAVSTRGNVVLLAACKSDESAGDAPFDGRHEGVFTHFLLDALEQGPQSYGDLIAGAAERLAASKVSRQTPQLECSPENKGAWFLGMSPT